MNDFQDKIKKIIEVNEKRINELIYSLRSKSVNDSKFSDEQNELNVLVSVNTWLVETAKEFTSFEQFQYALNNFLKLLDNTDFAIAAFAGRIAYLANGILLSHMYTSKVRENFNKLRNADIHGVFYSFKQENMLEKNKDHYRFIANEIYKKALDAAVFYSKKFLESDTYRESSKVSHYVVNDAYLTKEQHLNSPLDYQRLIGYQIYLKLNAYSFLLSLDNKHFL